MTIEELLKAIGVEDSEAIEKAKAEAPKHFMPLAEANRRIAAAKTATDELQKQFDEFKAEAEKAAQAAAAANGEENDKTAKALEELQAAFDKLQGDYTNSQNELKQGKARTALEKALQDAGANPAALALLANAGLAKVEYSDDGNPSNIQTVADEIKAGNAGLFGTKVDTGKPQQKGEPTEEELLEGFGDLTQRK